MPDYSESDLLPISGIQHLAFCERQWALIHVEGHWAENSLTVEGKIVHERADDPEDSETRGNIRTTRSVPVVSKRLGIQGIIDVVEYVRDDSAPENQSISLQGRSGRWKVRPVEYKRGKVKQDDRDAVQVCAQAIALEEMMHIEIDLGYLYYNEIKHRETVLFDRELRTHVEDLAKKMHTYLRDGITPPAKKGKHCLRCSLYEVCQPDWPTSRGRIAKYIDEQMLEQ